MLAPHLSDPKRQPGAYLHLAEHLYQVMENQDDPPWTSWLHVENVKTLWPIWLCAEDVEEATLIEPAKPEPAKVSG